MPVPSYGLLPKEAGTTEQFVVLVPQFLPPKMVDIVKFVCL